MDSSTTGPRRNLKKNQACLQCRRGKMKCDAAQPHCTNCIKAWQLLLETPGVPGSSAPACDYDPVEGLIFTPETISDPTARVRAIQDQLAQLHGKLQEARDEAGYHRQSHLKRRPTPSSRSTPSISSGNPSKRRRTTFSMDLNTTSMQAAAAGNASESGFTILPPITVDPLAERESSSGSSANSTGAPTGSHSRTATAPEGKAAASANGAMADLPPTETLEQLLDLFISNEPHASRIFHAQRLREAILLSSSSQQSSFRLPSPAQRSGPPTTPPSPPSKALLHAICASAARYVIPPARSSNAANNTNGGSARSQLQPLPAGFAEYHADRARRLINAALTEHQDTLYLEQDGVDLLSSSSCGAHRHHHPDENGSSWCSSSRSQGGQTCSPTNSDSSSSSSTLSSSATCTRMTSSRTGSRDDQPPLPPNTTTRQSAEDAAEDRDARKRRIRNKRDSKLFADMVQPLIVLATYYYHEGRGPEVWADVGALTRAIMSLGLNHPPAEMPKRGSPKENLLIAQEERRRAFWSTFMLDRLLSAGGWGHAMTEEDTVRNFDGNSAILSAADFRELGMPRSPKPQQPQTQTRHYVHPKHSDSYSFLIDAVVLLGRITDFRSRARLNHLSPLAQSILTNKPNQHGDGIINFRDASFSFILAQDPILRWEFSQLAAGLNGGVGYYSSHGISGKGRREGSMPLLFKYSIGLADTPDDGKGTVPRRRSMVDMDLFLAHMVHYAATILLHFPVASFNIQSRSHSHQSTPSSLHTPPRSATIPPINGMGSDLHSQQLHQQQQRQSPPSATDYHPPEHLPSLFHPSQNNVGESFAPQHPVVVNTEAIVSANCMSDSRKECVDAARKIVDALALLRCTTFELGHVHPFGATCWYIAGVVLLYEHRRWVDEGDMIQQTAISKDVHILRLSLLKYGQRSGIGIRLEEQLTAIQERIAAPPRGTPRSDEESENAEEYRHDVIPVFPFDSATYQNLPKSCPPSWGGAPLPQALV